MSIITSYASKAFANVVDSVKNQDPKQLVYRTAVAALGIFMLTQEVARPLVLLAVTVLSPSVGLVGAGIVIATVAANFLTSAVVVMSLPKILAGTSSILGLYTLSSLARKTQPYTLEPIVLNFIAKRPAQ